MPTYVSCTEDTTKDQEQNRSICHILGVYHNLFRSYNSIEQEKYLIFCLHNDLINDDKNEKTVVTRTQMLDALRFVVTQECIQRFKS